LARNTQGGDRDASEQGNDRYVSTEHCAERQPKNVYGFGRKVASARRRAHRLPKARNIRISLFSIFIRHIRCSLQNQINSQTLLIQLIEFHGNDFDFSHLICEIRFLTCTTDSDILKFHYF